MQEAHICEAEFLLALDKGCKLLGLGITFSKQEISSAPVVQVGLQFLCQGLPALDGFDGKSGFGRVASLAPHPAGASPGGCG